MNLRLLLLASLALVQGASAVPTLRISDGTNTITFSDFDLISNNGNFWERTTFTGSIGLWTVNLIGDVHAYKSGTLLSNPSMGLWFDVTSTGAGTLSLAFSEINFGASSPSLTIVSTHGTVAPSGSLTYTAFEGLNNSLFAPDSRIVSFGPLGPGAVSQSWYDGFNYRTPFSLTEELQITHGAGTSHTTATTSLSIPERGSTVVLFALGLLGVLACVRWRSRPARVLPRAS